MELYRLKYAPICGNYSRRINNLFGIGPDLNFNLIVRIPVRNIINSFIDTFNFLECLIQCIGNSWAIYFLFVFYVCCLCILPLSCIFHALSFSMDPQSQGNTLNRINWNHNTLFIHTIEIKFHSMKRLLSTSFKRLHLDE